MLINNHKNIFHPICITLALNRVKSQTAQARFGHKFSRTFFLNFVSNL